MRRHREHKPSAGDRVQWLWSPALTFGTGTVVRVLPGYRHCLVEDDKDGSVYEVSRNSIVVVDPERYPKLSVKQEVA